MNKITRYIYFVILLLLLFAALSGCVLSYRVIDGDTIKMQNGETIRYLGIDTPEKGEPLFEEAMEYNRFLLDGKSITFETDITDKDRYGRLLRYVYADGVFVNLELVRNGLAMAYRENRFQDNKYYSLFEDAVNEAYKNRLGIWALPDIHPKIRENADDYYMPPDYRNLQANLVVPDKALLYI